MLLYAPRLLARLAHLPSSEPMNVPSKPFRHPSSVTVTLSPPSTEHRRPRSVSSFADKSPDSMRDQGGYSDGASHSQVGVPSEEPLREERKRCRLCLEDRPLSRFRRMSRKTGARSRDCNTCHARLERDRFHERKLFNSTKNESGCPPKTPAKMTRRNNCVACSVTCEIIASE